jgi:hypothetical protein
VEGQLLQVLQAVEVVVFELLDVEVREFEFCDLGEVVGGDILGALLQLLFEGL